MKFTLKMLFAFLLIFSIVNIQADYVIPEVKIEVLKPKGIRVALPDSPGIRFFEFHANVNKEIMERDEGDIFIRVSAPQDGNWMFIERDTELKPGDVLHYWLFVYTDNNQYKKSDLTFKVE